MAKSSVKFEDGLWVKTGPMSINYYKDEALTILHREDGPAVIQHSRFSGRRVITLQWWCRNGVLHRLDGPAEIYESVHNYVINGEHLFFVKLTNPTNIIIQVGKI